MPAQYDVCPVKGQREGSAVDLALVLQDDILDQLATRVVAPLIALDGEYQAERAMPDVTVNNIRYMVATHLLMAVPVRNLAAPIANLKAEETRLKNAIDMIFFGI